MRGYDDGSKEVPSPRNAFHPSFLERIGEQDELELFNDAVPPALHLALCLVRSPESLKLLLAAAGGVSLEVTGVGLDAMYSQASTESVG